ncbi:MAG TPA: SPOR domain-containing protein [Burkholderiales bacterium]|nr:SPOR domain-containing protein [Burkholderiales bacterium]
MARPISDEELKLRKRARRRLIGAIVIVTAVVVALPMVLDNEPKPLSQDIDIRIPSPESAPPFTSKVVPVPDTSSAPANMAKPVPVPEAKPDASAPAQPSVQAKSQTTPPPQDAKPAAKPEKPTTTAKVEPPAARTPAQPGQYVVQVVALSDAAKAKQMQQAILKTGVKAYTEVVKTARGDVTRVCAGPYATRDAAEKAQQKLKGAGFDGKVVPAR